MVNCRSVGHDWHRQLQLHFINVVLTCAAVKSSHNFRILYFGQNIILFTHFSNCDCSKKVKCTLVQVLRLCTGRTAHRGSRNTAIPFLDHGTRRGWGVSFTPRPLFTPGKDPVPILQEAGRTPEPVWTWAENLVHTGIWSPDRPTRSQSLYRVSYRANWL
jgi:hypothetical protein